MSAASPASSASSGSDASPAAAPQAHVTINGVAVPVTAEPGIRVELALSSVPFRDWVAAMDPLLNVHSVHLQSVDMFGHRVGFVKFKAHVTMHGHTIPGIVFMRGGAVAILVVLECEGTRWALCCRQPRVPCGKADFLEIPAGMLDGSGQFSGVAAKELREETGLEIRDCDLVDMTAIVYGQTPLGVDGGPHRRLTKSASGRIVLPPPTTSEPQSREEDVSTLRGWYPSVGACDEFLRLMYYSKSVTRQELDALKGKATGCIEEGEIITLELVKLNDLWRVCPDGKTLAALYLYEKLVGLGIIPL